MKKDQGTNSSWQSTGRNNGQGSPNKQSWNVGTECNCDVAKDANKGQDDEAFSAANDVWQHATKRADENSGCHVHSNWKWS